MNFQSTYEIAEEEAMWTEVETSGQLQYKFFPVDQVNRVAFVKIKAAQDACVVLTSDLQEAGPIYEFKLGCSNNTKSILTKNRSKTNKFEAHSPGILDSKNYNNFCFSWRFDEITLFYGENYNTTLSFRDPDPIPVIFIGICTKGTTGSWKIKDLQTEGQDINTVEIKYKFFPVTNNIFRFKVKTGAGVYIALTSTSEQAEPITEIIIGTGNKKSRIRKNKVWTAFGRSLAYFHGKEYRSFWIRWDNGKISVGADFKMDNPMFMVWSNPSPTPIFYAGIASKIKAEWRFEAIPANPDKIPETLRLGNWVDASTGLVPPGAVVGGEDNEGGTLYVARVDRNSSIVPSKLMPSSGKVFFNWCGSEILEKNYQVLVCSPSNIWISTSIDRIPPGACPGGKNKDGRIFYIGRVHLENDTVAIGRVPEPDGYCYITVYGKEIRASCYDILMA